MIDGPHLIKFRLGPSPVPVSNVKTTSTLTSAVKYSNTFGAKPETLYFNLLFLSRQKLNGSLNNFLPLIYFVFQSNKTSGESGKLLFKLYNLYISDSASRKYNNLYAFFLVNFLEIYLNKKI